MIKRRRRIDRNNEISTHELCTNITTEKDQSKNNSSIITREDKGTERRDNDISEWTSFRTLYKPMQSHWKTTCIWWEERIDRKPREDSWMLRRHDQLCNSTQLFVQEMETNIELCDIQRTRHCEDTSIASDSCIRGGL